MKNNFNEHKSQTVNIADWFQAYYRARYIRIHLDGFSGINVFSPQKDRKPNKLSVFKEFTVNLVKVKGVEISSESTSYRLFFVVKLKFHKQITNNYTSRDINRIIDNVLFFKSNFKFIPMVLSTKQDFSIKKMV